MFVDVMRARGFSRSTGPDRLPVLTPDGSGLREGLQHEDGRQSGATAVGHERRRRRERIVRDLVEDEREGGSRRDAGEPAAIRRAASTTSSTNAPTRPAVAEKPVEVRGR